MPKPLSVRRGAITIYGLPEAQAMLGALSKRLADPVPILEATMRALEQAEVSVFEALSPHFVLSGATRASLTQPDAAGAIREIHGFEARFGTSIWWAKFLRKIDGKSGKPRGRKRVGPNLVLKTTRAQRAAAVRVIAREILLGGG